MNSCSAEEDPQSFKLQPGKHGNSPCPRMLTIDNVKSERRLHKMHSLRLGCIAQLGTVYPQPESREGRFTCIL